MAGGPGFEPGLEESESQPSFCKIKAFSPNEEKSGHEISTSCDRIANCQPATRGSRTGNCWHGGKSPQRPRTNGSSPKSPKRKFRNVLRGFKNTLRRSRSLSSAG